MLDSGGSPSPQSGYFGSPPSSERGVAAEAPARGASVGHTWGTSLVRCPDPPTRATNGRRVNLAENPVKPVTRRLLKGPDKVKAPRLRPETQGFEKCAREEFKLSFVNR